MLHITVIGSGNVAWHLINAINLADGITLKQVMVRQPGALDGITDEVNIITTPADLQEADIYIIAVSDNAIEEVTNSLPFTNRLVVHTSGATALESLNSKNRRGVFYPLQTFSKARKSDFSKIPLCLEAEHDDDYKILIEFAKSLSSNIFQINSAQRKSLHIAAVFVSNFSNHMYTLGNSICKENSVPFDILKPLITETANKVLELSPVQAQTGPAIRHDNKTINRHIEYLEDDNMRAVYTLLTQSIQQTHGR